MIAKAKSQKCMAPGCEENAGPARGVCINCYAVAKRLVERHLSTWEELAEEGLVLAPRQKRVIISPMYLALIAARANKLRTGKKPVKTSK